MTHFEIGILSFAIGRVSADSSKATPSAAASAEPSADVVPERPSVATNASPSARTGAQTPTSRSPPRKSRPASRQLQQDQNFIFLNFPDPFFSLVPILFPHFFGLVQ